MFYVSVINGKRKGLLLGPYATHEEALANVDRGREMACKADGYAWFYFYGTCRIDSLQKTVFGC